MLAKLDQVAHLVSNAKSVTRTGYTDKTVSSRADKRVSASQARAACVNRN